MKLPTASRRRFIQGSIATAAALTLRRAATAATPAGGATSRESPPEGFLTDVNVYVSHWPFRRVPADEAGPLAIRLQRCGVRRAWTANLDGVLHKDLAAVNVRLVEICRQAPAGLLVPFGTINPAGPDWEEDLRRCHEVHGMPGVRLHPNYHGYRLDDPRFLALAAQAERRGLIVQIPAEMEDRRTQHRLVQVPPVELSPLVDTAAKFPRLKLVVLNTSLSGPLATRLAAAGRIHLDTSHQEGLQGLSRALQSVPLDRIVFGSHAPLFIYEANLLKLRESPLSEEQLRAIVSENADRLAGA